MGSYLATVLFIAPVLLYIAAVLFISANAKDSPILQEIKGKRSLEKLEWPGSFSVPTLA